MSKLYTQYDIESKTVETVQDLIDRLSIYPPELPVCLYPVDFEDVMLVPDGIFIKLDNLKDMLHIDYPKIILSPF